MQHYAQVSGQIHAIFERYTPLVEPLSLDEAFLDVAASQNLFGPADVIGKRVKEDIRNEVGLIASVGVAPNKFLAKVASDIGKPNGYVVVDPARIHEFLDPLPVGRLWGVGKVTGKVFEQLGISTIGQLRQTSLDAIKKHFGKSGEHFWQLANGIDDRRVIPDREAKSISHETTFAQDIGDMEVLRLWLLELTEQVARRLRRHELVGRTVHLKIRFADFRTITRSETLAEPSDITQELWQAASGLLSTRMPARHRAVRLLGMGVSGLENAGQQQGTLFDAERVKQRQLDNVADQIKERFGMGAIGRAAQLQRDEKHRGTRREENERKQ